MVPSQAIKGGATTAPIAAPLLKIPEAVDRSLGGNHSEVSFIAAGQFPASPIPNKNRKNPNQKEAFSCLTPSFLVSWVFRGSIDKEKTDQVFPSTFLLHRELHSPE